MLWALLSSAYVIYLYRKLKAEQEPQPAATGGSEATSLGAELDKLNQRLDSIEARLDGIKGRETAR
ncbi:MULTISPECIES: hypothetical protein [unclassified Bradyrhizobium]|uniref:hypothetical protein n=1 Tax=unclassified Bradyrhizobium TaxID=2631580 RepID=UPI002FEF4129